MFKEKKNACKDMHAYYKYLNNYLLMAQRLRQVISLMTALFHQKCLLYQPPQQQP